MIFTYKLYWDNAFYTADPDWETNADLTDPTIFLSLVDDLVTTHTVTGLTAGYWYLFAVRA